MKSADDCTPQAEHTELMARSPEGDPVQQKREQSADAIFAAAMAQPKHAREAFVRQACGNDDALLKNVMLLLGAVDGAWNLISRQPTLIEAGGDYPRFRPEAAGQCIGKYQLREQIGE